VVAYFDTGGLSNGGTEAINLLIEKTDDAWRTASATSPTTGYGSCSLPAEHAPTGELPPMHKSEEPSNRRERPVVR
jgi:hypothetical protein